MKACIKTRLFLY